SSWAAWPAGSCSWNSNASPTVWSCRGCASSLPPESRTGMSACVRWRCMEWRNEYGACIDPAQCAGLVADRTGRRPGTPSAAPAPVGGGGMDRVCVMAGPDTAHALALSRIADADRGPGGGHPGRIRCPGNADRAGCGSDAAVVAVHAQTAGDAQTPGRTGGYLPGI